MAFVFDKLREGLRKTREVLWRGLAPMTGSRKSDPLVLASLEEALIAADVGVCLTDDLIRGIREAMANGMAAEAESIRAHLRGRLLNLLALPSSDRVFSAPWVILMVGVNGAGKTTSAAKLAWQAHLEGKKVLLAGADTYRAAAIDQLSLWSERVGAQLITHRPGADPSAVAFDAVAAAKGRGIDLVLVDTAGRLHTRIPLMEELKKMKRVIGKGIPDAPHESLLVVDAVTGQNGLSQARSFHEALGITGIILTKMDGTTKGGIVLPIVAELGIAVRYIGVGEAPEDLLPFDPLAYVDGLLGPEKDP